MTRKLTTEQLNIIDIGLAHGKREELKPNPLPEGFSKWQAKQALAYLRLNGPEHDVALCLVEHANGKTGKCWPSQERISAWTNRAVRTVERAIKSLGGRKVVDAVRCMNTRGTVSNSYIINWQCLASAYAEQKVSGGSLQKVSDRSDKKCGVNLLKGEPTEENLRHEMSHADGAGCLSMRLAKRKPGDKKWATRWRAVQEECTTKLQTCDDPEEREQLEQRLAQATKNLKELMR